MRAALTLGFVLPAVLFGGCNHCNPDNAPEPSQQPETSLVIDDASNAETGAKDTGQRIPTSLKTCCHALSQNAAVAQPPTKLYMQQAAAACLAAVAQGKDKRTISGIVSGALKGAAMPAACR